MKFDKFSPNLLSGIISIIFGLFIYYKIPSEVEKPVLIFGQSSSEIDPQIVPTIVALMFLIFGLYTAFYEKDAKISNSWPKVTKQILINISTTIICLILYSILFEYLGFVISSVLLILSLGTFMGNVNFKYLTVISILFPLSIFFLFVNVMHVFLPEFPFYEIRIGNFLIM
jgi:putative tricarboxylic transport membrane protein